MSLSRRKIFNFKFTIVELLTVIVVIGILLCILLPRLVRAREYARQASCMSNTHQIALAYKSYLHDYKDYMPDVVKFLDDFRPIYPYVRNFGVFNCPSSKKAKVTCEEDLEGKAHYLVNDTLKDVEKKSIKNNGAGNNVYHFDPSCPSPNIQRFFNLTSPYCKKDDRIVYERDYYNHFNGVSFNVAFINDLHCEKERGGVAKYWVLDSRGWIETSINPYPNLR